MRLLLATLTLLATGFGQFAFADELDQAAFRPTHDDYAMGVRRFRLEDGQSKIIGWQLGGHWYVGQWRGDEKGFGFVWQGESTQIAITDEGINWRRRVSFLR